MFELVNTGEQLRGPWVESVSPDFGDGIAESTNEPGNISNSEILVS